VNPATSLTRQDELFRQVALHNKWVTGEQIAECEELLSGAPPGGRRRSLAELLVIVGYLTAEQSAAVEAALRRRGAAPRRQAAPGIAPEPSAPPPSTAPSATAAPSAAAANKRGRAPSSAASKRGRAPASAARPELAGIEKVRALSDAQLRAAVARIFPGRIYPEMLEHIVERGISVIDPGALASALDKPRREVVKALKHWLKAGVLREVGTHPYNFGPTSAEAREIRLLLRAWRNPRRHADVLAMILAHE
jgi:hypothetical protein